MEEANRCNPEESHLRRRTFLKRVLVSTAISTLTPTLPSNALVYVDPNRYGDKELQVGIVSKIRQVVRDTILKNPFLAPTFLEISIQDALSYDTNTMEGGPNGQVVDYILSTTSSSSPYYIAAKELSTIKSQLQKSTAITMADVVTFAGAQAIETLGGPRIVVQLGKLDSNDNIKNRQLYNLNDGPATIQAFQKTGLTERDVTLLFGAIGSMQSVLGESDTTSTTQQEEEEPNEMGDVPVDFPSTFGAPSDIYGKRLGKMNDAIFSQQLALQKKKQATGVWSDAIVGEWTQRYAKGGFFKDLAEAYSRLVRVGSTGRWEP